MGSITQKEMSDSMIFMMWTDVLDCNTNDFAVLGGAREGELKEIP